jgi:hypothetical protein
MPALPPVSGVKNQDRLGARRMGPRRTALPGLTDVKRRFCLVLARYRRGIAMKGGLGGISTNVYSPLHQIYNIYRTDAALFGIENLIAATPRM